MQLSSLLGVVLVGALYFALDAFSGPSTALGAPAQSAGVVERVLLTVSEQRAHQALRVEADRHFCSKAGSYAPGGVKSFERRAAEL
jgi:hypothetical protein